MFLDDPMISMVVFYPRKTKMPDGSDPKVRPLEFQINEEIKIGGICYVNNDHHESTVPVKTGHNPGLFI